MQMTSCETKENKTKKPKTMTKNSKSSLKYAMISISSLMFSLSVFNFKVWFCKQILMGLFFSEIQSDNLCLSLEHSVELCTPKLLVTMDVG